MAHSKLNDDKSLECSICISDFDEPKQLPCLHTFCLKCLKKYCEERDNEFWNPCPLCRETFSCYGGLEKLPNNEMIEKLILMKQARELEMKSAKVCDLCAEIGETIEALAFCSECQQRLCYRCKQYHAISNSSKFHQVTKIDVKKQLLKRRLSYCSSHSDEEMEFYCCDCNVAICSICKLENHKKHNSEYFQEVVKRKKLTFTEVESKIKGYYDESCDKVKSLKQEQKATLLQINQASLSIKEAFNNNIKALEARRDEVLQNLAFIKSRRLHVINHQENLNQRQNAKLNEFLEYGRMMMERGTDCEIIRVADELHKRAEELSKIQDKCNKLQLPDCCIKFIPSPVLTEENVERTIGEILITDNSTVQMNIRTIQQRDDIVGVTVLNNLLYFITDTMPRVCVYDLNTGLALPIIRISDTLEPRGLAGCSHNKALYISDFEGELIYRVNLIDNTVTCWKLRENYMPFGLAVTSEHNLLITVRMRDTGREGEVDISEGEDIEAACSDASRIVEYTSEGQLIRDIELDRSIERACHTIPLTNDQFLVSHGSYPVCGHRLCVINSEGQIIKSYSGEGGNDGGYMNEPRSIAMDANKGHVFVADRVNARVLMFNTDLALLGQVQAHEDLSMPWGLYFDSGTDRLFVGDWEYGYVTIIHSPEKYLVEPVCF